MGDTQRPDAGRPGNGRPDDAQQGAQQGAQPGAQARAAGGGLPFAERVNDLSTDQPWQWLAAGWADLRAARWVSVAYGLVFVAVGYAVTAGVYQAGHHYLIWPLACGFVLVAPAYAVGIYGLSRAIEAGRRPTFGVALTAWRDNPARILGAGLAFTFFMIIWLRVAVLIYALAFPGTMPTVQGLLNQTFFSADGLVFLVTGTVAGAVFAVFVFLAGAVSLPMMLGEKADFLPAVFTSAVAVARNPKTMFLWGAIIVVVTAAGIATAFVGLAVTLPLIGHATWHCYRATIRPKAANS